MNTFIDPLLMQGEADTALTSKPVKPNIMSSRQRSSNQSTFQYKYIMPYLFRILLIAFLVTFTVFIIVFYMNVTNVSNLYSQLYLSTTVRPLQREETKRPNSSPKVTIEPEVVLSAYDRNITYEDFNYLNPDSMEYTTQIYSGNVKVLFRLPKNGPVTALLLIFHGCSRSAHDWFHTVERQRIIGAAIDLGYACLAFQATDDTRRCWSSAIDIYENDDIKMVFKGLEGFYKENPKLESLPRFTFGASSGGIFSSVFVTNKRYKIQGQILFISIILPELLETFVKKNIYPPTAWIYMTRDIEFASQRRINESIQIFSQQKIPYKSFPILPVTFTSTTFHDRIPTISIDASNYIFYRFLQNHWLDAQNLLKYNPRRKNTWQTFLFTPTNKSREIQTIIRNLEENKNVIPDFLNTIYGEHEISYERSYEALKWHMNIYNSKI